MELCVPPLTNGKSHPVDYFKNGEVLNGNVHAKIGFIHPESFI
jgi:hypothetical protein